MRSNVSNQSPKERRTGAPGAVRGAVILPSQLIVCLFTLAFALGLRLPESVQYLPFAASLVLFGLPHGAVDHLVPSRLAGRDASIRDVLAVVLLYAALSSICVALWFTAPALAFSFFILVTIFHWGAGDLHALLFFGPEELGETGRTARALLLSIRGGIPMVVPLLFFPDVYREVAGDAVALFGPDAVRLDEVISPKFRLCAGGLLAAIVIPLFFCVFGDLAGRLRPLLPVTVETLLLVLFFAVVPPVLAVGLYFTLWHAPRHIARLVLLEAAGQPRAGRDGGALARFAREAAPLTALAIALLAGLYLAVPGRTADAGSLLALYLVLVSALTLPHAVLVSYMDARQGLWHRRCRRA